MAAAAELRTIFLNRAGGTYTEGPDDSTANVSGIVDGPRTVSAPQLSDAQWQTLMGCVRETYSRFNVTVTDVDPGMTAHIEAVVTGGPEEIGAAPDVAGLAITPSGCPAIINETGVMWIFAANQSFDQLCWTVAQETAHAFGLEHAYLCEDPMTYLYSPCGTSKSFQDADAQCGESAPRPCLCGATQNSVQTLYTVLGPADAIAPTVSITSPQDGESVPLGFQVFATAMDNLGLSKVELWVDGNATAFYKATVPFVIDTPLDLALGAHTIEVVAYDTGANTTHSAPVSIMVTPGCSSDDDCDDFERCTGSACVPGLGAPCTSSSQCSTGLCDVSEGVCSQLCADGVCPSGFECQAPAAGGADKCYAVGDVAGPCECRTGGAAGRRRVFGLGGLFVGLALFFGRRRR